MTIRPEGPDHYSAVSPVVRGAFDDRPNESALVDGIRQSEHYRPDYALVAERRGDVIGHVCLNYVLLRGEDEQDRRVLELAPLSVKPGPLGQDIGTALTQRALALADAAGEPLILVLGDARYYERFGFAPASASGITAPAPVPAATFLIRRLSGSSAQHRGLVAFPPGFEATGTL
jgi:putative acetyltransferase